MPAQIHIDYLTNPLGILRRYDIPYGDGLKLEARVIGIVEDGFDFANWFQFEVRYPQHNCEIGGLEYRKRRGGPDIEDAQKGLDAFCASMNLRLENPRFL